MRPYLHYILGKEKAIQESKHSVKAVRERLNKNPLDYARNAIDFLNGLTEKDLKVSHIMDSIYVINWGRKVVNHRHHLDTIESKIGIMAHEVRSFIEIFNPLVNMGLPFF